MIELTREERDALVDAVEAAREFSDGLVCLDPDCSHKTCVLNKAVARFDFGDPA